MSFLAPFWIPLVVAGLTVPTLLLLYFLKLRRQEMAVSSTLLWRQAIQDLQVNAPFQRLKNNLLLWLQMLALLAAVFCLWQPVVRMVKTEEKTAILLIDQSASMATREADGRTRLQLAKEQAKTYIGNLDDRSKSMVITFADRAHVVVPFTTDKQSLRQQIDAIEQTDSPTRLGEALQLAEAYSTRQVIGTGAGDLTPESPTQPAEMVMFSDGRVEDASRLVLRRGTMEIAEVGQTVDNVGIISIDARRNYERPELLNVFVTVGNFGPQPIESDVALKIDGRLMTVSQVKLGASMQAETAPSAAPATRSTGDAHIAGVSFELTYDSAGIMEIELARSDAFPTDNRAWVVVQPPRSLEVLLVSSGNYFLKKALGSLPLRKVEYADPEVFEARASKYAPDGKLAFDVAILDRCSPAKLPTGNYVFFGAVPRIDEVKDSGLVENEFIYDWDDQHPILRHVLMNYLRVSKWRRMELPARAIKLVEGETTQVMALVSSGGSRFLIVAFDLYESNWPLQLGFPVFIYNAIQYLASSVTMGPSQSAHPGEALPIPVPPGVDKLTVRRPDGRSETLPSQDRQAVYYSDTRRLGVYRVEPAMKGHEAFAVNLLNSNESNIRPVHDFKIGTDQIAASQAIRRENRPLWPWLLLGAMGVLLLEWYIYNRRVLV
jgi:Mg-chelatase subunit ChlD